MKRKSNQRITKIKKDRIKELLEAAESIAPKDGTSIQQPGEELVPYPNFNYLRIWTRDYLTKGLDKVLINNMSEDGQTYITTLIDGLPLFTKLTKSISTQNLSYKFSDSLEFKGDLTTKGATVSGFGPSNAIKTSWTANDFQVGTELQFKINSGDLDSKTNDHTIFNFRPYGQLAINKSSSTGNWHFWSYNNRTTDQYWSSFTISSNTVYWVKMIIRSGYALDYQYSTDGSTWNSVFKTTFTDGTGSAMSFNCIGNFEVDNSDLDKFYMAGSIDLSQSYKTNPTTGDTEYLATLQINTVETTKPGLWLSNLIQPRSNSTAGSWLCQNLINTTPLDSPNLDTLGNYSYSFLQRGIYHRTSGSVHYNHDSYAQHWSPSYLSCISHDSLIIPFNNLRRTYTPYQTIVFPIDPDMQAYEETECKDIEYQFANNTDNLIPDITDFNGRIVGEGWSYEFKFDPNGNGSGNDYGGGGDPTGDNGSNGGCVTGSITYSDSIYGTSCTQEINSCFQTTGSYFNPDVPDLSGYQMLDQGDETPTPIEFHGAVAVCRELYSAPFYSGNYYAHFSVTDLNPAYTFDHWEARRASDGEIISFKNSSGVPIIFSWDSGAQGAHYDISFKPSPNGYCQTGVCGVTGYITKENPFVEKDGVDIYMIITDLKCQYESNGLPWTYGCGTDRFTVRFSTQKSDSKCDKNILIASNIDINKLGDISKLNSKNLKG